MPCYVGAVGYRFGTANELAERLRLAATGEGRPITFLLGSGISLPRRPDAPGVPGAPAMVELVRSHLGSSLPQDCSYQHAFSELIRARGLDAANAVIREAVLQARLPNARNSQHLERVEEDTLGWHIPEGLHALAALIAHYPKAFGNTVLTTNFDPLIEVALSCARVPWFSTSLHADGSLLHLRGSGTHVVHLHGHWWGSDTLHTPSQLKARRPQLQASIRSLAQNRTLVVIGYGGWKDAFMSALRSVAEDNESSPASRPDVLWGFYPSNAQEIRARHRGVLRHFSTLYRQQRCFFYGGVDFDRIMLASLGAVLSWRPAESLAIFLNRYELLRSGSVALPNSPGLPLWPTTDSPGEFVKQLDVWGRHLPTKAALSVARYLLPALERQPIHSAPDPQQYDWVRATINNASRLLVRGVVAGLADIRAVQDDVAKLEAAVRGCGASTFDRYALECAANALCSAVAHLTGIPYTSDRLAWASSAADWAAATVHLALRALHDDEMPIRGCIEGALRDETSPRRTPTRNEVEVVEDGDGRPPSDE